MPASRIAIRRLLALVLGVSLAAVAQASPPFFTHHKIAARGEVAPRSGGAVFWTFPGGLWVNAAGAVAFSAELNGGTSSEGLFLSQGGQLEALVLRGDPAPASIGGSFGSLPGSASFNDSGALAFLADVTGGPHGLFLTAGGVPTPIVLEGDPVPENASKFFNSIDCPSLNDAGAIAFIGSSELGEAIYVHESSVTTRVVGEGDPAPGGRRFYGFECVVLDDSNDLLFVGHSYDASSHEGLFLVSGGEISLVASTGDPAPGTGGGSYSSFYLALPDLASGGIVFHAGIAGGDVPIGLFRVSGGVQSALALYGSPAPAAIGGLYDYLDPRPHVNAAGDAAFRAGVAGGTTSEGIFLIRDGVAIPVALSGDPAPGTGGGVHSVFADGSALSELGAVAFLDSISFGTTPRAIFLATPPPASMPGFGIWGSLTLAFSLLAAGSLKLRRH